MVLSPESPVRVSPFRVPRTASKPVMVSELLALVATSVARFTDTDRPEI